MLSPTIAQPTGDFSMPGTPVNLQYLLDKTAIQEVITRWPTLPDTPTVAEASAPGYALTGW